MSGRLLAGLLAVVVLAVLLTAQRGLTWLGTPGQPSIPPGPQPLQGDTARRPPEPAARGTLSQVAAWLQSELAAADGSWGIYVEDLSTGSRAEWGSDSYFAAASTLKLPAVLWAAEAVSRGGLDPWTTVTLTEEDRQPGTGILLDRPVGAVFTVHTLMGLALTHSDNTAFHMLVRHMGGRDAMLAALRSRGGRPLDSDGLTYLTPRELGLWLRRLWEGRDMTPDQRRLVLDWLQQTEFNDRIPAGLPAGMPVAHKIGTLPGAVHDAAIVLAPGRPYSLVIMSSGLPEADAVRQMVHLTRGLHGLLTNGRPGAAPSQAQALRSNRWSAQADSATYQG